MKYKKKGWIWLVAALLCGCQKQLDSGLPPSAQSNLFSLRIVFHPVADDKPLQFNGTSYTNAFNEPYTVKTFKFYISQIDLVNTDSAITYRLDRSSYFLVDQSSPAASVIALKPVAHRYNQLRFVVGVDSTRNVSGAQTGALDPSNGMFWTWNSGYIMAKLEGTSPLSNQPGNRIEYHIGGFKEPYNVLRRIELPLPNVQAGTFRAGAASSIVLSANVNAWFHNPNDLHIAQTPVFMTPGDTSRKIAENYSHMFNVTSVSGN